jgi:hypothetical protein
MKSDDPSYPLQYQFMTGCGISIHLLTDHRATQKDYIVFFSPGVNESPFIPGGNDDFDPSSATKNRSLSLDPAQLGVFA